MARNTNLTLTNVLTGVLVDIFFFPFWWYSFGLFKTAKRLAIFISDKQKSLALLVWMKNIFVPMYGQRDIQGFIISFFIRLVQIIFRGLIFIFWLAAALVLLLLWLVLPAVVIYEIFLQIS
jgi:hypothetical protein